MATIIKEILLIFVLTTDSFVVSFAYGMRKVKMPFKIVAGMNVDVYKRQSKNHSSGRKS